MTRFFFQSLPLLLAILVGSLLFTASTLWLQGDVKNLGISMSAALVSIPLIYLTYELSRLKSQRALNAQVYQYARNEMSRNIGEIRDAVALFLQGAFHYFAPGTMVFDDDDIERIRIRPPDAMETEVLDEDQWVENDVLGFDKTTIVEPIADARYLGFQLPDLDVGALTQRTEQLLANTFTMQRLDASQTRVIVHLVQSLKALDAFIRLHDDVFVRSNIQIPDYAIHKEGGLYHLWYQPGSDLLGAEGIRLDVQRFAQLPDEKALLAIYVVNPDYYMILGDLVEEVTACIRDWSKEGERIYLDYGDGLVQPL